MYQDSIEVLNDSAKKFTVYAIALMAFGAIAFFIFFLPGRLLYNEREHFYFLIFPIAVVLIGAFVRAFIRAYFVGRWLRLITSLILYLTNGISIVLLIAFASHDMKFLTAIVWVVLFSLSIVICKASDFLYTRVYGGCLLRAFSYILMGLSIKSMLLIDFAGFFSNCIMVSFIILALLQVGTLVELMYTEKSRRLAMWLKNNHLMKYIGIFILVLLAGLLRRDILSSGLAGWIFVFLVLLVVFIIIAATMWGNVKYSNEEKLAKHILDMNFDKSKDLELITRYIEEYVNYGKKSRLVSYLTYLVYKSGIPFNAASNIIAPLVEYSDPEIPGILTSEQYKAIEERNRQNRSKVIEKITSNLKLFGKGVYVYNGYGTGTKTMQDYN